MPARVIFVHGTTVRDVSKSMAEIRKRSARILDLGDGDVVAVEWGRKVGPPARNFIPALPPEYSTRAAMEYEDEGDPSEADVWALLMADPSVELRMLAAERSGEEGSASAGFAVGGQPPSQEVTQKLKDLAPPQPELEHAEIAAHDFQTALKHLLDSAATVDAVATATGAADPELSEALANSLVARMLVLASPDPWRRAEGRAELPTGEESSDLLPPAAALDAEIRTALVSAVLSGLGSSARGGNIFKRWGGAMASRVAVSKRAELMAPLAHFLHDVTFYLSNRDIIQGEIIDSIEAAGANRPVVVLAHSLGGIAAVDLLSKADAPQTDLLVTVGSQAPLLYLMDALADLKPDGSDCRPKVPWLNIYNRDDLLAFCAQQVFPDVPGIMDRAIDAKVPFPAAHSAYWRVDEVYELIRQSMADLGLSAQNEQSSD